MTLTGSIGVVMGKFVVGGLWDRLGLNWDSVSYGANADLWSFNEAFDADQSALMNELIDETYTAFLQRVAEGRDMPVEEVREIAKGRAWTGLEALELGLVDDLGGLSDALTYTAKDLGAETAADLDIVVLPRPENPLEQFLVAIGQQGMGGAFALLLRHLDTVEALAGSGPIYTYDSTLETLR